MAELEGFICPLCVQTFANVSQLEGHYKQEHEETRESKLKANIRSFFGKTLGIKTPRGPVDEGAAASPSLADVSATDESPESPVNNVSGIDTEYWPPQQFGCSRDYVAEFKQHRDAKVSQVVVETNRLVIRLEKLFRALKETTPRTSKQMKEVQKTVVPWHKDQDEKRCGTCGRGFNVTRRRHHCRLCGSIICKSCSTFMTLAETHILLSDYPDYHELAPSPLLRRRSLRLRRAPRREEEEEGEGGEEVRMCLACRKLVERRLVRMRSVERPLLSVLYEKMQLTISEADTLQPTYSKMAESLLCGEHCYALHTANDRRQELIKLYDVVDSVSKHILGFIAESPSPRNEKLCKAIRTFASGYLQENLLSLPSLPTAVRLREIRAAKEREAQETIKELERQREAKRKLEASLGAAVGGETATEKRGLDKFLDKFDIDLPNLPSVSFKKDASTKDGASVSVARFDRTNSNSGWMSDSIVVGSIDSQEDPFVLQQQQLLSFISQARDAGRLDEVAALESSLREIEFTMDERKKKLSYGFSM